VSQVDILNVGYRSTNYWVVSARGGARPPRILVDLGWPGEMGQLRARLKQAGAPLEDIRYGLATHYHIDHAGLGQELKLAGVSLLVIDLQQPAIPLMKQWTKPQDRYTEITLHDNVVITCAESRALLARLGIAGEILHTPGHSDDSVSLLLDNGAVFTGDLIAPEFVSLEDPAVVAASWQLLRSRGATTIYPGHGPIRPMP